MQLCRRRNVAVGRRIVQTARGHFSWFSSSLLKEFEKPRCVHKLRVLHIKSVHLQILDQSYWLFFCSELEW